MCRSFVLTRCAALDRLAAVIPRTGHAYAAGRNTDVGPHTDATTTQLSSYLRRRLLTEQEVIEGRPRRTRLRMPGQDGQWFRRKADTDSDGSRTVIPIDRGQL